MLASELNEDNFRTINIIERVGSVLSLLGCFFIITTFTFSKAFHKPINRLVFYASFGNIMTNVATLIARSYVERLNNFGCQFQALLIQMFLPADALFALAMAVNVYLTFYHKFDAQRLRRMEIYYVIGSYGIPFVPAFVYIWVKTAEKGRMYGNATLWCWVSSKWDIFRIATFYGPVWVVIAVIFGIYIRAGKDIYEKRKQLRDFSYPDPAPMPMMGNPFMSVKTTEIYVTSEAADPIDLSTLGRNDSKSKNAPSGGPSAYTVTISSSQPPQGMRDGPEMANPSVQNHQPNFSISTQHDHRPRGDAGPLRKHAVYEANNAAWSYTKCAVLFFTALLVTWIPSSANRVYSVVHPNQVSLPLEYMSALVLPLQGFWNAVVYIVTSLKACRILWADITSRNGSDIKAIRGEAIKLPSRNGKPSDTESMTELASRDSSGFNRKGSA